MASGPEDTVLKQGQPLQLSCEAKGYPVPSITWEFVASDGTLTVLPGEIVMSWKLMFMLGLYLAF